MNYEMYLIFIYFAIVKNNLYDFILIINYFNFLI